jgi:chromosome partitioning protein
MKTLVFANQKGGVGKSAVACQFSYYGESIKQRVLFIDLDHQKNSTKPILANGKAVVAKFTASQLLGGQADLSLIPEGNFAIIPADDMLSTLERQPDNHNIYVNSLKAFIDSVQDRFDLCIIDTNPNPDIRYAAALIVSDFVLSPIQLNQEAIDGIGSLLNHSRYGYKNIKAKVNPKLELIGILPNMVEPTPFQRNNFKQLVTHFPQFLIAINDDKTQFAFMPKRSSIAEAQAEGAFLADIKKTAAREAWRELKTCFDVIAQRISLENK